MLCDGQPYFLDYQGRRKGALQYDIASLLYDGKADLPQDVAPAVTWTTISIASPVTSTRSRSLHGATITRTFTCASCQAMGPMASVGFMSARRIFSRACRLHLNNLRWLAHNVKLPIALPALMDALHGMLPRKRWQGLASSADRLKVRIFQLQLPLRERRPMSRETAVDISLMARNLPQSRPGRTVRRRAYRQGRAVDRLSSISSPACTSILPASCRLWMQGRQQLSAPQLQKPHGFHLDAPGGQHRSCSLAEQLAPGICAPAAEWTS